ncbi:hypothetical protein F5Y05DRAFT_421874 [Hypoxylon sp. FL0543]|nr:hypothetical protein F5Y05DRAFT_421874 [Hypoxylon sp. FL0543]
MSQPPGDISPASAWIAIRDELTSRLSEANTAGHLNVTGITSMPASGKSTTMVSYIIQLAQEKRVPDRVIYVIPDATERLLLSKWLLQHSASRSSHVTITGIMDFLRWLTNDDGVGSQAITLLIEVNWYPTTEEELLFAELVEWGQRRMKSKDCRTAIVLLMSIFESERTMDLLKDSFGLNSVKGLSFPSLHTWPKGRALSSDWDEVVSDMMGNAIAQGGRVIKTGPRRFRGYGAIGAEETVLPPKWVAYGGIAGLVDDMNTRPVLSIRKPLNYSSEFPGLRIFLSQGDTESIEMDAKASQLVRKVRKLEPCELLRNASWLVKSVSNPEEDVTFLTSHPAPPAIYNSRVEAFGPAWNADLVATVLSLVKIRGGKFLGEMHIRRVPNRLLWGEGLRRLCLLQCLERDQVFGTYRATDFGGLVYQTIMDHQVDFHVAYLLSMARSQSDLVVQRVLIRIAALSHVRLMLTFDPEQRPTLQERRAVCAPLVRDQVQSGYIWQLLGIYLAIDNGDEVGFFRDDEMDISIGKFTLFAPQAIQVQRFVKRVESRYNLLQGEFSWRDRTLSEDQTKAINRALMWSWLHRMVWLHPQPRLGNQGCEIGVDIVSSMECQVDMPDELMDAPNIRQSAVRTNEGGGIVAIYAELFQGQSDILVADSLTSIPAASFNEVQEKTGIKWPAAVMRVN